MKKENSKPTKVGELGRPKILPKRELKLLPKTPSELAKELKNANN